MSRLRLAAVAAAALLVFGLTSRYLPAFHLRTDIIAAVSVAVALLAVVLVGLVPLRRLGNRLLAVAAISLPLALLLTYAGWIPLANLAKIAFAAALGLWLAEQLDNLRVVVLIAAVIAVIDIYSVFAGPTKALLAHEPQVVGYFTVALTWFGYSFREAYSAIGTSDLIFFSLFLGTAELMGLRVKLSAGAMAGSFVATVILAFDWVALPALPLLSAAFLAVNADLIVARWRTSPSIRSELRR